jgi:hypothetical protein
VAEVGSFPWSSHVFRVSEDLVSEGGDFAAEMRRVVVVCWFFVFGRFCLFLFVFVFFCFFLYFVFFLFFLYFFFFVFVCDVLVEEVLFRDALLGVG